MSAEALALVIAGLVAPWVVQAIKNVLKLEGPAAAWLTFGVAVVIAVAAVALTGGLSVIPWGDPLAAIQALGLLAGVVFTIASLVYKSIGEKAKLGPVNRP